MSLWIELLCQSDPTAARCPQCGVALVDSAATVFLVRDGADVGFCGERCLLRALGLLRALDRPVCLQENWLRKLRFYEPDETGP